MNDDDAKTGDNEDTNPRPFRGPKRRDLLDLARDLPAQLEHGAPPEAQRFMGSLFRDAGGHTPYAHFATLAVIVQHLAEWVGRMEGLRKRLLRYVLAGASFAALHLSAVGIYALNRHDEAVAARERAVTRDQLFEEYRKETDGKIEQLRLDVRELRRELRRIGIGPGPEPDSRVFRLPDKLSFLFDHKGPPPCLELEPVTLSPLSL